MKSVLELFDLTSQEFEDVKYIQTLVIERPVAESGKHTLKIGTATLEFTHLVSVQVEFGQPPNSSVCIRARIEYYRDMVCES